ncbi:MAG: AAA family ATPase [Candidatus Magasanikbacteria bacterium]|nr:AAA family ATPase [Candidatus Magasanikbacteria bacterium]
MFLKSIELQGFKSFAQSTLIEFPPPQKGSFSITAIVGPNGSGKSNVADAIRWVLGEQSLKQLRGKKSEDVIFGGSEYKGRLGMASVSVTLDNSEKRAGMDYEELVITRKVYRNGENEYLINGAVVRLFDLQLMLAQAQFGQSSYSVIGQGMITQLLVQTAAERKQFFDEAVGIKEFQIKRHQALLKLNRTAEHIAQADMLLLEVEPRMRSLKRQVKKLEQRKDVEIRLRDIQEQYYVTLFLNIEKNIEQISQRKSIFEGQYAAEHKILDEIQTELAALAQEASRQEQFELLQRGYQDLLEQKNECERERAVLAGKLHTEYSKAGKQNIAWLEEQSEKYKLEKNKGDQDWAELKNSITFLETKRSELRHELSEWEEKKLQTQRKILEIEKRVFEGDQSDRLLPKSGYRAVEAILQNHASFGGRVYGMVAELGRVAERFQRALEIAAGHHMTSLVVESDAVADSAISFLKKHQLGTATFLPLNTIRARPIPQDIARVLSEPGVRGLALELIEFDPVFEHIFSYVFGSTVVVDDVATARRLGIGRMRMVTLDGDMMSAGGSMRGGFRQKTMYTLSFSTEAKNMLLGEKDTEEHLQELRKSIARIDEERGLKQDELLEIQTQKGVKEHEAASLSLKQQEILKSLSQFEQELSLQQLGPEQYDDMMKELSLRKDEISLKIDDFDFEIEKFRLEMKKFNELQEKKRKRVFDLQEAMQSVQNNLNRISNEKNEVRVELAKLQTRREDMEEELYHELKTAVEQIRSKIEEPLGSEELDQAKVEIEKLKYNLSLIGGIDEEVLQEYMETKEKYEHLHTELNDLKRASGDMELLLAELDTLMKKRHSESFKKIKKEFERYFKLLFEGGKADLVEVYGIEEEENSGQETAVLSEEPEARRKKKILRGIDVVASPPGKKIEHIAALSGGERTLTSIALVCAILHINPPPFVLFDEVEAALDEANTLRFTTILKELSGQSQFILITHNRATMHAADALYGVSMGNDGVSKLLSVSLDK